MKTYTHFSSSTIVLLVIVCIHFESNAQIPIGQIGYDINGQAPDDYCGISVSMPNAHTVAVGAPGSTGAAGKTRIFEWNGSAWIQKGNDIYGEFSGDGSAGSISMPDENTIAIGANNNDGGGTDAGHVRIYSWNGSSWIQKGTDIDGEAPGDGSGYSVCMPDPNTVAIGAPNNFDGGAYAGQVRIYSWNGSAWVQKGMDVDGIAVDEALGFSLSMPDSNTFATGAPFNSTNGTESGVVRIYSWNGNAWTQKGLTLVGEAAYDYSGWSVSMPDSNTIAIGAYANSGSYPEAGHVRIYSWNGSTWQQKGMDIDGAFWHDQSGSNVCMPDPNTVAIAAKGNDDGGTDAGQVRIFSWNGSAWAQRGPDIDGATAEEASGWWVSMPDTNTIAIGAPWNDFAGINAGVTRVFTLSIPSGNKQLELESIRLYFNPYSEMYRIDFGESCREVKILISNENGQNLKNDTYKNLSHVEFSLPGPVGVYFLEIYMDNKRRVIKTINANW